MVALALALFSINVVIPGVFVGIGATGLMGFAGAAVVLERIGALTSGIFEGAAQLSLILLGMALIAFAAIAGWNGFRRLAGRAGPPPLLLRWPWVLLGLLLFLACQLTLPEGNQRSALPVLPGALVIAFSTWVVIAVSAFLIRMSVGSIRLSWRIAQASPFGAGMLTLAALAATGLTLVVGSLAEALQTRAHTVASARPARCDSLSWECSRQALLAARPSSPAPVPTASDHGFGDVTAASFSASAGSAESTVELNTRACLERPFRQPDMMARARRIAQGLVRDDSDADDLIHSVLLNICLRRVAPTDFERYFLRSVEYGARSRFTQLNRSCPLDGLPDPQCLLRPDDQYVEAETHEALRKAFCSLTEQQQQLLRMRYFDDLDEAEIGRQLTIEHATARKRIQRARDDLRTRFLQQCQ
nr:sigma-70 family RNA polymerase sigma factor [Corallococcus exercitus]